MYVRSIGVTAACLLALSVYAAAAPAKTVIPERLEVNPSSVKLDSKRAYRQLVVTGYVHGEPRDLTRSAAFTITNGHVAKLVNGRVLAESDGATRITIKYGGRTIDVPVVVSNCERPDPVRFQFETLAVLTKQGCATGSCHGSPHGKGGFSLSLFGYDPRIDRISLTRDGFNRRINMMDPSDSLMLKKPLLEIPHVGGKRLHRGDAAYHVIHDWIAQGANVALSKVQCSRIVLYPDTGRVLRAADLNQQMSVLAYYTDGSVRDVSSIATFETSNADAVTVDPDGLVTGHSRGQAAVSVRYLDKLQSVDFTVVKDIPGFAWTHPPEKNYVDRLVDARLKLLQYLPSGVCSDAVFLRRIYLDLTGMLPGSDESRAFLADRARDKRARLIDTLLDTEEYARFWALKEADLMRVTPRVLPNGRADLFASWLVDSVRTNMPYDKFAHELLTASGDTTKVAPANYFMAIPTTQERTEMTAELFMGTRVECARCHNHPFENWTMRDYYSMGAVFARTEDQNGKVVLASTGETTQPNTGEVMRPWGMTPEEQKTDSSGDRRALYADWLTKANNPYFARVAVNRLWSNLMGRGIVEPVDDFRSSNPPSNGPLLDALAEDFIKSGYDRKRILRTICNSDTYQRVSQTNAFNKTDETLFSHAHARLLSAEQMKDALGLATRTEAAADAFDAQLDELQTKLQARKAALEENYGSWMDVTTIQVSAAGLQQGGWYEGGPYKQAGANALLPPEHFGAGGGRAAGVDWQLRQGFIDGTACVVSETPQQVNYLARAIYSADARTITIQISATDTASLWLNGSRIAVQPIKTAQTFTLALRKGENQLLLKITNRTPRATFTYKVVGATVASRLPDCVVDIVMTPPEARTADQRSMLDQIYLTSDPQYSALEREVTQAEARMQYATQRPYPEESAFTVTFGQPARSTACTCERLHSPTLLQALELLNGGTAYQLAQAAVQKYAPMDNTKLLDELYLSAFCRTPTDKERATAGRFLAGEPDRNKAVMDLVWTVVNTQEFLFQH